jgi:hypothetical protein
MRRLAQYRSNGYFVVSFDEVYFPTDLDAMYYPTRGVYWDGSGWSGKSTQVAKAGTVPLAQQIANIFERWQNVSVEKPRVVVVDDGVFEGASTMYFFKKLNEYVGVHSDTLGSVLSGLFLESFMELDYEGKIELRVEAVHHYPRRKVEVIDWICERDFFAGIPQSGRAVIKSPQDSVALQYNSQPLSVPYWQGCGNLNWASVPDDGGEELTRTCASLTARLFNHVAVQSHRNPFRLGELPRLPAGIGFDPSSSEPFDPSQPLYDALQVFLHRVFGSSCQLEKKV